MKRKRNLRTVLLIILAAGITAGLLPNIARADIRRPDNAETEIENYFREFLGRPSDPNGFTAYRDKMWQDCKFGVLAAGMMIGDSQEAHNRLRTPNAFVPQLFRALLNRDADAGGLQTYVNVVNARGYRWAIADIQASAEFRNRLNAMCQGRRGAGGQNELKPDQAIAAAVSIDDAGMTLVKACGAGAVISLTAGLATKGVYEASRAIRAARLAMEKAVAKGSGGACLSAYQVLKMADDIATVVRYEPGANGPGYNNPAYVLLNQSSGWEWNGYWCHVQMGGGASAPERSWREVKFRCS